MNEKERLLSFLGIARKAQRLSMGADAAKESLQKGKARLVLLAGDLSPRSERNARAAAEEAFQKRLESHGITATVRRSLGGDIDASCGQLRRRAMEERKGEDPE